MLQAVESLWREGKCIPSKNYRFVESESAKKLPVIL